MAIGAEIPPENSGTQKAQLAPCAVPRRAGVESSTASDDDPSRVQIGTALAGTPIASASAAASRSAAFARNIGAALKPASKLRATISSRTRVAAAEQMRASTDDEFDAVATLATIDCPKIPRSH